MALIPAHQMAGPRATGVEVPAGSFQTSTRALVNLVQTVGGSVDTVIKYGERAQEIRNKGDARKKMQELEALHSKFLLDMQDTSVDPSEYVPRWQAVVNDWQDGLKESGVAPVVMEQVQEQASVFSSKATIKVGEMAFTENRQRVKGIVEVDIKNDIRNGRYNDARIRAEKYGSEGILDPVEVRAFDVAAADGERDANLDVDMDLAPDEFIKELDNAEGKYKDLSPQKKMEWKEKAEQTKAVKEREQVGEVVAMIEADVIKSEEDLKDQLEASPNISSVQKKILLDSYTSKQPIPDEDRYAIADAIADDFNQFKLGKITFDEYRKRWNQSNSKIEAYGKRPDVGSLKNKVYQKDPIHFMGEEGDDDETKRQKAAELKDINSFVDSMVRERADGAVGAQIAKMRESPTAKSGAIAVVETTKKETALIFRDIATRKIMDWIVSSPKPPNSTEIQEYLNKIQPMIVDDMRRAAEEAQKSIYAPPALNLKGGLPPMPGPNEKRAQDWLNSNNSVLPPIR